MFLKVLIGCVAVLIVYLINGAVRGKFSGRKSGIAFIGLILAEVFLLIIQGAGLSWLPFLPEYECSLDVQGDTAYVTIENQHAERERLCVDLLDPATGYGTFRSRLRLAEGEKKTIPIPLGNLQPGDYEINVCKLMSNEILFKKGITIENQRVRSR